MKASCPKCGAENPTAFPFCMKCGEDLQAARAEAIAARGLPEGDSRRLGYLTFSALSSCRHCGGGLPVQGPMRSIRCSACQGVNEFPAERLAKFIGFAADGIREVVGAIKFEYPGEHCCPGCGAGIDLRAIPVGEERRTPCPKCGRGIVSYPPPAWLKAELPTLLLVIGGERDPADVPVGAAGAQLLAVPATAAPVVLACPNCRGSLKVDGETARTTTCQFCSANVYLPDDLWRILHPVKRVEAWTMVYDQQLATRDELEQRRRKVEERAREAAERVRREAPRLAPVAEEAPQGAGPAKPPARSRILVALLGAVLIGVVVLVLLLTK